MFANSLNMLKYGNKWKHLKTKGYWNSRFTRFRTIFASYQTTDIPKGDPFIKKVDIEINTDFTEY